MSKVIIINDPSRAGKTTIAKEICRQSHIKFVNLQIDKSGEFYSTIFPKGFLFAENYPVTENYDDGLKVIDVHNEHGCQIILNGIMDTIKYYLRLISSLDNFISNYIKLVEVDTELKKVHKEKLNFLIARLLSK